MISKRIYTVNYHERGADEHETKRWPRFVEVIASNATTAIAKAKAKVAEDFCLDRRDIVVDEVTLT